MKKTFLLFAVAGLSMTAKAQSVVTLPTTGSYYQDFNGLPTYPTGWHTYNNATATSIGTSEAIQYFGMSNPYYGPFPDSTTNSTCIGGVNVGGFKEFPSANVLTQAQDLCATPPPSFTDRALGVRQVSPTNGTHPNLDPGASFVVILGNTTNMSNFAMSFKLQSLDTASSRVATWTVDYGIGSGTASAPVAPTTFTPVTTVGTMTTGGHVFSNDSIYASLGTALNNKTTPVYVRISALSATSGSGNRPSSAIDDFRMTYTYTVGVSELSAQNDITLNILGAATTDKVTLAYSSAVAANYSLSIYDLAGRVLHTQNVAAPSGAQTMTVNGLHMAPGMYIAKMNNGNSSTVAKFIIQ